ncbi:MAG: M20/M25/M40 family metallo-hydrolase [Muribaculaceae bacterium]|nr:M20/M25/M40 family metallo-hydrolase [Muribaculaceae bacterium]
MKEDSYTEHPRLADAVSLLSRLIETPSFSREETATADIWEEWLKDKGAGDVRRFHNNVYVVASGFDPTRPTLMLNSHHDTVRPVSSYTRDPFSPTVENGRLYGLGSNDAGASGVALASTFLDLKDRADLPVNLIFAITAAEECMGEYGMRAMLPHLSDAGLTPDMVIVGEPTGMEPAVAERGLVVLDAVTEGVSGHAARNEGINAIYRAIEDINSLRDFTAPTVSPILGPVRVSVTMINAGTQHNVVPDRCSYVVDVRTTDAYTNAQTVDLLRQAVRHSTLTPRSTRVQASVIALEHPLVVSALGLGMTPFVSPTTSDMALMHGLPSLKIGPGQSSRSHSADEFVEIDELNAALHLYPKLILNLNETL